MARLARRLDGGRWHVTIVGLLKATDLGRLERTCAPALDRNPAPLDLQLDRLTGLDEPARLFVSRLMERGAMLKGENAASWADEIFATDTRRPREDAGRRSDYPRRFPDHSGSSND